MIRRKFPKGMNKNSIETIIDYENERCYKTSFKLNRRGKSKVLVLGRAPKKCSELYINKSVQRIVKYLNSKKETIGSILNVVMVNLFVPFEYDRETIKEVLEEKGESFITGNDDKFILDDNIIKNNEIIKEEIMSSDYIILAWGEPLKDIELLYNSRVQDILKIIRNCNVEKDLNKVVYTIGDLTKKGYPRHCMNWNTRDELVNYFD